MAYIEHRSGAWRISWLLGGRGGRKQSVTAHSEKRALVVKGFVEDRGHRITDDEVYAALFPTGAPTSDVPTLAAWAGAWEEMKRGDVQDDTLAAYMRNLRRWVLPRLGDYQLDAITTDTVRDWVLWMRRQESQFGRTVKAETVRRVHSTLHQLLAAAVGKHLAANPAAKVPGSRKGSTGLPKSVTYESTFLLPSEADLIIAVAPDVIRDMVVVSLYTGLRLGELVALRVMDVNLAGDPELYVRRALKTGGVIGYPKSERSRRTVSLSKRAVEALAPRIAGRAGEALVFTTSTGEMWDKNNIREKYWKPTVAAAQRCPAHMPPLPPKPSRGPSRQWNIDEISTCGCPTRLHKNPRWHDLRHSAASWLIAAKWDLFTISRRLGHESTNTTTAIYGHLFPHGDGDDLQALDRLAA